jgi:hypothetical protein
VSFNKNEGIFIADLEKFEKSLKESDAIIFRECMGHGKFPLMRALADACESLVEESKVERCDERTFDSTMAKLEKYEVPENGGPATYPGEYYHGDTTNDKEDLKKYCGTTNWSTSFLTKTFMEKDLPGVFNQVDETCQRKILETYQKKMKDQLDYAKRDDDKRALNGISIATHLLSKAIDQSLGTTSLQFNLGYNCFDNTNISHLNTLEGFLDGLKEEVSCVPLRPGESRSINVSDENSGSGVKQAFRVTRTPKGFNLDFKLNFANKANDDSLNAEIAQRTKECYANMSKYLKGPKGEELNLNLIPAEDYSSNVPGVYIKIMGADHRSNSSEWNKYIDCPTIIHETLHLVGLCDEYKERSSGYVFDEVDKVRRKVESGALFPQYDCRAIGPEDSVMRDQNEAIVSVAGGVRYYPCEVFANIDDVCLEDKAIVITNGNSDFSPTPAMWGFPNSDEYYVKREEIKPTKKSLISPAHFKVITRANCNRVNSVYNQCAQAAYKTSSFASGDPKDVCPDIPKECQNGSTQWLNGQ